MNTNDIIPAPGGTTKEIVKPTSVSSLADHCVNMLLKNKKIDSTNEFFIYRCLADGMGKQYADRVVADIAKKYPDYQPKDDLEAIDLLSSYCKDIDVIIQHDFWKFNKEGEMVFKRSELIEWLESMGYRTYLQGRNTNYIHIRSGKILKEMSLDMIRSNVNLYLIKKVDSKIRTNFIDMKDDYFSDSKLKHIKTIQLNKSMDSSKICRFFFQNGFVEVTDKGISPDLQDIYQLDGRIWESQIIKRELLPRPSDDQINGCDFARFVALAMDNDQDRIDAATSAFCYLIHNFKTESNAKAIVVTDKAIGAINNESEGRSGKGLMFNRALREMVNICVMEAPDQTTQFPYERVNEDTRVIVYDELPKTFSLRKFFTRLTSDFTINKKNKPEIVLPYADSPKFALCTNFPIPGNTDSTFARMSLVEFGNYFNGSRSPVDEFKREFFSEKWDADEWNRFYWLVIGWMQEYLRTGLKQVISENNPYKRLVAQTDTNFADFIVCYQFPAEFAITEVKDAYIAWLDDPSKTHIDNDEFRDYMLVYANTYKKIEYSKSSKKWLLIDSRPNIIS